MRILLLGLTLAMLRPEAVAAADWSGFYAGAELHLAAGDAGYATSLTDDAPDLDLLGGAAAVHAGHRWQRGDLVFAVETAAVWQPLGDRQISPLDSDISNRLDLDWMVRTTAALGYARNAWLAYARFGHAFGAVETSGRHATLPDCFSTSRIHHAITAGAGLERQVSPRLSAGLAYDYTHFFAAAHGGTTALGFDYVNAGVSADLHSVSVRLSYRFGGAAGL